MARAFSGAYSPDGHRYAYEEISTVFIPDWYETSMWRHYRGGRTHPIRVMALADHTVEKLPWRNSNDSDPMWVGNTIYFLSDRNFTTNLFSYRLDTKALTQVTHHGDSDIMTAGAGPDAIAYEQNGYIHLFDVARRELRCVAGQRSINRLPITPHDIGNVLRRLQAAFDLEAANAGLDKLWDQVVGSQVLRAQ